MRFVSLFTGVGGFDLGFEQMGWECAGQVEIDKKCVEVLEHRWPDVPRHDDVTTAIDWAESEGLRGSVDVVCGGFPCQDVSVAGKRAGLAGERTGLFWDALAFAKAVEARWVVLENVPGLLSSNKGRDFGTVITTLAEAGYPHIEWRVLDSQYFGVAQRRKRLFIVASARPPRGRAVFVESQDLSGDSGTIQPQRAVTTVALTSSLGTGGPDDNQARGNQLIPFAKSRRAQSNTDYETWVESNVTPTLNTFENHSEARATTLAIGFNWQNGGGYGNANDGLGITMEGTTPLSTSQIPAAAYEWNVRRLTPVECERLQGFPDDWTTTDAASNQRSVPEMVFHPLPPKDASRSPSDDAEVEWEGSTSTAASANTMSQISPRRAVRLGSLIRW